MPAVRREDLERRLEITGHRYTLLPVPERLQLFNTEGENPMAKKNSVIMPGSPRKNANSTALAEQVAVGAEAGGASVETFYLPG